MNSRARRGLERRMAVFAVGVAFTAACGQVLSVPPPTSPDNGTGGGEVAPGSGGAEGGAGGNQTGGSGGHAGAPGVAGASGGAGDGGHAGATAGSGGGGRAGAGGGAGGGAAGVGGSAGSHGGAGGAAGAGGSGGKGGSGGGGGAPGTGGSAGAGGFAGKGGGSGGSGGSAGVGGGMGGATAGAGGGGAGGSAGAHGAADAGTRMCTVKINEIQTGGATALDEFVELYNTCPEQPLDLSGYTLVYRSAAGTTDYIRVSFTGGGFTAGKPYFVCANTGYAGPADAWYTDGLADAGGGLALRAPDQHIVDSVGWGTATNAFVEGSPAPAPSAGQSIARIPDGHDTDNNSADFHLTASPTSPGEPN
jgi:hypothetical protein